jgi:AcrR family transcriptional regulator
MTDRTNRRDLIVDTAGKMFIERGYEATSVRQIAEAVGCTEAALYYHFKDGKRALLQAVVECNMPDMMGVLDHCREATSLYELIKIYGREMAKRGPARLGRMRWLIAEFPNFSDEERALFHGKHMRFHDGLAALIEPFVDTPEAARELAWTITCASFGYGHLFFSLDLKAVADFPPEAMIERLARALSEGR